MRSEDVVGHEEGERLPVYDHVERRWRHLDTCGFATELVCRVPRVQKPDGKVETVSVPWRRRARASPCSLRHGQLRYSMPVAV
ncbi:MAG: transposase family protein [Verrucomicrobiaceae bacterium]|nr:MAG: transposase family protein [Verrucomicrobiaceae bacterium]